MLRRRAPGEGSKRTCFAKKVLNGVVPAFVKKCCEDAEDQVQSLPFFIMARSQRDEHDEMNKERGEAKLAEKQREEARVEAANRFETDQGVGLQSLLATPIFTPPKTSMRSTNLTINENPTTIASGASKGGSNNKIKKYDNESPFVPVQDCALGMQNLVKQANVSLFMDLTEEADEPRDKKINSLNIKLKQAKDAWHCAVGSDDVEREKTKKRKANDLEDEIDESLDSE